MIVLFCLVEMMFQECLPQQERKAVNKRILFSINKSSHSTIRNEGFVKKNTFSLRQKTAFTGWNIYVRNGFTLVLIMVSTSMKFALNKRTLEKKSVSTRRNEWH